MSKLVNCKDCCYFWNGANLACVKHKVRIYQNLNNPEYCNGYDFKSKLETGGSMLKFELGKYYKHTTGTKLYICGLSETYYHGRCFVGENARGELSPVGSSEENAINYTEITREQFIND